MYVHIISAVVHNCTLSNATALTNLRARLLEWICFSFFLSYLWREILNLFKSLGTDSKLKSGSA